MRSSDHDKLLIIFMQLSATLIRSSLYLVLLGDYCLFLHCLWQIKSLRSTLQTLPSDMRAKAMDFINKTMSPVTNNAMYVSNAF